MPPRKKDPFGRQAAAGDMSAHVTGALSVNAVLPDGRVELREHTMAYQSEGQRAVEVARREEMLSNLEADRRKCNAVAQVKPGQELVIHGCPTCRVEFMYEASSMRELEAMLSRSEPVLRCPRCAPPP